MVSAELGAAFTVNSILLLVLLTNEVTEDYLYQILLEYVADGEKPKPSYTLLTPSIISATQQNASPYGNHYSCLKISAI